MKKTRKLSEITADIGDQVKILEEMVNQVTILGENISKIVGNLGQHGNNMGKQASVGSPAFYAEEVPDFPDQADFGVVSHEPLNREPEMAYTRTANIIPFPIQNMYTAQGNVRNRGSFKTRRILAVPEMLLPPEIPDFRPLLQRDGLILLAWDKRMTEMGERFTAYWVTSSGVPRYYASKHFSQGDFPSARPDHKSYAAEDGIEFFGQEAPDYLVHVAPELMMSNPRHKELRQAHINILLRHEYGVDYGYSYLLTKEKKRNLLPGKSLSKKPGLTGA